MKEFEALWYRLFADELRAAGPIMVHMGMGILGRRTMRRLARTYHVRVDVLHRRWDRVWEKAYDRYLQNPNGPVHRRGQP